MIDLGVFRVIDGKLVAWDPRVHAGPWVRTRTRRERRREARFGTRGRRGTRPVPRREQVKPDRLPDVVQEMVNPRERLEKRTAEIRAEMERLARRIGIMGAFYAREDVAIARTLDSLGQLLPRQRLEEAAKVLEDDERCDELARELHRLEDEFDEKYSLKAFLARGATQSLPAPEYLTFKRREFHADVQTDERCRCMSERCFQRGRHVETLVVTLYCEGDPNEHAREVERLFAPKVREIVARRVDAMERSAQAFQNILQSNVVPS